jgi:hypothetical protein
MPNPSKNVVQRSEFRVQSSAFSVQRSTFREIHNLQLELQEFRQYLENSER